MKANSASLETFVEINQDEARTLKTRPLTGNIRFRDDLISLKREIPFKIRYKQKQKDLLVVRQKPRNSYFGFSRMIEFTINQGFYDALIRTGNFEDRFYTAGKLVMRIKD